MGKARPARDPSRCSIGSEKSEVDALAPSFFFVSLASSFGSDAAHLVIASAHHGCSLTCAKTMTRRDVTEANDKMTRRDGSKRQITGALSNLRDVEPFLRVEHD